MPPKILVVDDNPAKLARIIKILEEVGLARAQIDVAQTGVEARKYLTASIYDLMILDIALPMRPDSKPDRRGGISLLEEIVERGVYRLPQSVVGLTAYDDLQAEFTEQFRSRLWHLDHFDSGDGWSDRLRAKAIYVVARHKQRESANYKTDLCVITGLQSPEIDAIRSLDWQWGTAQSLDDVGFYYQGTFRTGDSSRTVAAAAAPRMGMVASAIVALKMINRFRPKLLAMVGICAGVKDKCAIGDALLANPAWDWQMGKRTNGTFAFAPHQIDVPTEITERFVQLGQDQQLWFDLHRTFPGPKPNNIPSVKVGPVASGSSVLADLAAIEEIKQQHRKLIGVEMELYGVYAAARDCAPPRPICFGLKSVADFGDEDKDDKYQPYAAYVSARGLAAFCERYAADL
jgi:nucleoside phosphorylase